MDPAACGVVAAGVLGCGERRGREIPNAPMQ